MPARNRKAEAASRSWKKRKTAEVSPRSNRPSKLKQWTDTAMRQALEAVRNRKMGINAAARMYQVPPTTLKDRISGRVKHGSKPGPAPYLTADEESKLVEFLSTYAAIGYGKTFSVLFSVLRRKRVLAWTSFSYLISLPIDLSCYF